MYIDYTATDLHKAVCAGMEDDGDMVRQFGSPTTEINFDTNLYDFRRIVEKHLISRGYLSEGSLLEDIHSLNPVSDIKVDLSGQSKLSTSLYDLPNEFDDLYLVFLKDVIREKYLDFDFYFQTNPTFRCSVPGSPGYSWRPNYHTDIAIGHPPSNINFWFPVTKCAGNNSLIYAEMAQSVKLWSKFDYNFEKFHSDLDQNDDLFNYCQNICSSYDSDFGKGIAFDARCMHLHQKNDTQTSRISFDFRVISVDSYKNLKGKFVGTGRRQAKFRPGGYYFGKSIDQV